MKEMRCLRPSSRHNKNQDKRQTGIAGAEDRLGTKVAEAGRPAGERVLEGWHSSDDMVVNIEQR